MTCYIKESIRCDISKVVGNLVKPFANSVCDSVTSHKQRHILPTFESCLFFYYQSSEWYLYYMALLTSNLHGLHLCLWHNTRAIVCYCQGLLHIE